MRHSTFSNLKFFLWVLAFLWIVQLPVAFAATTSEDTSVNTSSSSTTQVETNAADAGDFFDKFLGKYFNSFSSQPSITTYFVRGDRGRFRQDQNVDDGTTGGVQELSFSGEKNGVKYAYEGHAIVNYNYLSRLRIDKDDDYFLHAEWKRFRKYWDGGQDRLLWDPSLYNRPDDDRDFPDQDFHTDRGNVTATLGKTLSDTAKLIIEYELWTREGRFTTLRGEQTRNAARNLRARSMITHVDGYSNLVRVRLPFVAKEIHHFEPLISFEAYRDGQFTESSRYNVNGTLNQTRDYIDSPEFDDLKVQLRYHSFLTDNVYVHSGYFFNFLRNDSVRSEVRPNRPTTAVYVNPDVDNWRISNVFAAGTTLLNFLHKKRLDLRLGFRGEHAITDAHGTLWQNNMNLRASDTALNEGWFGEMLSMTYRGLKKTTVFLRLAMEQRRLHWRETFDARSHEAVTNFGSTVAFPHYETHITYIDFVPTLKIVHRINSYLKTFFQYKWKSKQRRYNTVEDTRPGFYPGFLGDEKRNVHEVIAKADCKLPYAWMATLRYQLIVDQIGFPKVSRRSQNLDRDNYSLVFSGPMTEKLFMYAAGTYEFYRVKTPENGPGGNRWGTGRGEYNFDGDYFILTINPTYQLTKRISTFATYQITDSLGSNRNLLNEVTAGFTFDINPTTSFEARYRMFDFNDRRGMIDGGSSKGFNDSYIAHGMSFSFKKAFA